MTSRRPATPDLSRLLRFLVVGGGFAVLYAVTCAVLIGPFGFPPYATSVIVYVLCIPAAYLTQKRVTFGMRQTSRASFPIYAATQIASLATISSITTLFVTRDVVMDTGIYLMTSGVAAVVSYLICTKLAFRSRALPDG